MEYRVKMYEKTDGKLPVMNFIQDLQPKQQAKITLKRMKEYLRRK